jgi:thiol:disulfide interchange protein
MKENCFLYKDKFKVSFNGEELKSQNKKGKSQRINDIYFGEVEVYFDQYEKEIYIEDEIDIINVTYQGCNEKGFCYPLINKIVSIEELGNS